MSLAKIVDQKFAGNFRPGVFDRLAFLGGIVVYIKFVVVDEPFITDNIDQQYIRVRRSRASERYNARVQL